MCGRYACLDLFCFCSCSVSFETIKNVAFVAVGRGGILFLAYLMLGAPRGTHQSFIAAARDRPKGQQEVENSTMFELRESCHLRFHSFCLLIGSQTSRNIKKQQFWITFCVKFFGCSRSGITLLSRTECLMPLTSFDRTLKGHVDNHDAKMRYQNIMIRFERYDLLASRFSFGCVVIDVSKCEIMLGLVLTNQLISDELNKKKKTLCTKAEY